MNIYLEVEEGHLFIQEYFSNFVKNKTMKTLSITKKLQQTLTIENHKFEKRESKLSGVQSKILKIGLETKSTYSLPMKDTIGKNFRELLQFKSI